VYSDQTILYYLKQGAARFKEAPAVTGGGSLTYAELDDLSDRIAAALLRRKIDQGEHVGVSYDHGYETLLSVLGILKAGAAYVPLNPKYPAPRLAYMMRDAGVSMVLGRHGGVDAVLLAREAKTDLPEITPQDRMAVIYTSGSSDTPKGVVLKHENPMGSARYYGKTVGLGVGDAMAAFVSLSFIVAMNDFCSSLAAGATLCYVPRNVRGDMRKMEEYFAREGIAHSIIPALLGREFVKIARPGLRSLTFVGEIFAPPDVTPACRIYNGYGSTEVAGIAAMGTSVKVRPIDGVAMRVSRSGEIIISGPCVGEGYLNAAKPFDGEFHTGDLAQVDDAGEISIVGRSDFQIKIHGYRVQPEEIDCNAKKFPDVQESVTVANNDRLTTYFSGTAEPDALKRYLEHRLPRHMIPAKIVRVERMPHNHNGKIDRAALQKTDSSRLPPERAPFRTETERRLAGVWSRLLETEIPGRYDIFEDLGGDSLSVMLLALEIESIFGKVVPPAELFKATLKEQAILVDSAEDHKIAVYNESGCLPPLFFVHTANSGAEVYLNFLAALPDDQPLYVFENHNMLFSGGDFEGIIRLARRYAGYLPPLRHYRLGGWSLGGLIAFEIGLILQERGISSDLYLVDPYVITSDAERELSATLEVAPYFQDYLNHEALFERFRDAGLMERMIANNSFCQREVTRYVPTGIFNGKAVLFKSMKTGPFDSETLRRLWEMRRPDNGFSGFTKHLRIVGIDSIHDRCMSDPRTIQTIVAEINRGIGMKKIFTTTAKEENMEAVQDFIAQALRENGFTAKAVTQTLLAAEEIFINITHYAYDGDGDVEISAYMEGESAVVAFADSGKPYNPLEKVEPDVTLSADDRPIGGLGIFMARRLTDAMEYERIGGRNILRIKKSM
jgi:acyl-CoA synthetase (AMP-forming)/AMP-acid ligase II/anti-sigma regulatory factor (Ser/Thr protein kinase)/thioesterase domain-containing protein/acyl carrier protein